MGWETEGRDFEQDGVMGMVVPKSGCAVRVEFGVVALQTARATRDVLKYGLVKAAKGQQQQTQRPPVAMQFLSWQIRVRLPFSPQVAG
jgi:hypothetical protein